MPGMPPSFTPFAAPRISLGNTAGNLGQAISSVVAAQQNQQMLRQKMAMLQALQQSQEARNYGSAALSGSRADYTSGPLSQAERARAGLYGAQAGLAEDQGGLAKSRSRLTDLEGNVLGATGSLPGRNAPGGPGGSAERIRAQRYNTVSAQIERYNALEQQYNQHPKLGPDDQPLPFESAYPMSAAQRRRLLAEQQQLQQAGAGGVPAPQPRVDSAAPQGVKKPGAPSARPNAEQHPSAEMSHAQWQANFDAIKAAGGDINSFLKDHPEPSEE